MTVRDSTRPRDTRGQAFTLEAVAASIVVVGALLFALQASGVTSLTESTSSQQVVTQQGSVAAGTLDAAAANDTLRPTLLYWNETAVYGAETNETYRTTAPPTAFGALLREMFENRSLAYNLDVAYVDATGSVVTVALVRNGVPTDDAARATRTVTLYDDDRLRDANGTRTNTTVTNATFYAPDRSPGGPVYAVVRVEVVVWRV